MLKLTNITLARGVKQLIVGANLTLFPGHKVGLIGPNGAGKSSLFSLLRRQIHQDVGDFDIPAKWIIAHVAQETPHSDRSALDFALDGDQELRALEAELAAAELADASGEKLGELHEHYDHIGGYQANSRGASLLAGLGFTDEQMAQPVASFSGGWRMRLNLAQALMCRSDLLLLDEPTNHLDLDAVMWLEDWLTTYPGTLLLITHDRDFLDAVVTTIVHLDNQKLNEYGGNYSTFERTRAMQLALQGSAYAKQQKQVAHLQSFIDRFKAKATKAKQAQSRMKTLERMELITAAHVDSPFSFTFRDPVAKPRQLLHLKEANVGYTIEKDDTKDGTKDGEKIERTILTNVEWRLFYGDKIGLLGPNGAGKSTLVKSLAGTLGLQTGGRFEGQGLKIGYFAQHQIEQLRLDESPIQHMRRLDPTSREQEFRNFLGGFDFRGVNADAAIAPFSGGEKARLALALLVWQKPNLLLLDEPTNHLDIEMREAVAEALQDFDGTLVVVAHDRHLLKACADQLWLVADGGLREFDGDLDDYKKWARDYAKNRGKKLATAPINASPKMESASEHKNAKKTVQSASPAKNASNTAPNKDFANTDPAVRKEQKRAEADVRQKLSATKKPLEQKLNELEKKLKALNAERENIETWLATESAYAEENKTRLQEMLKRQVDLVSEASNVEWSWLEVQQKLEEIAA